MKNYLLLLFVFSLSTMCLISCSSSDDGDNSATADIVGKWQFDKVGGIQNGEEILMPYPHECPSKKDHWELLSGGIGKGYLYEEDCSLVYGEGTWSKDGDTFTIIDEDGTEEFEILILNSTTLKLKGTVGHDLGILVLKRI